MKFVAHIMLVFCAVAAAVCMFFSHGEESYIAAMFVILALSEG